MPDKTVSTHESEPWSELLQHARRALATLEVDSLEELAGRAECMLAATMSYDPIRQRIAKPQLRASVGIAHECSLLGDLLYASERNLRVLRVTCEGMRNQGLIATVVPRWVR
jgi:hypothetical protein